MAVTPSIGAPEIIGDQNNKDLTHNEALRYFDAVIKDCVINIQTTPPVSPNEGDAYIVGVGGTGDWAGQDSKVAFLFSSVWKFIPATECWVLSNKTDQNIYRYNGSAWVLFQTASVVANKNLALDSDFKFWTNGITNTFGTYKYVSGGFSAERGAGVSGATASRQTGFSGSRYALRVQRNNGNTSVQEVRIGQIFDTYASLPLAGKNVTISFDARAGANYSPDSSFLTSTIYTGTTTNQGGNLGVFTAGSVLNSTDHTLTATATKFQHTFMVPADKTQVKFVLSMLPVGTAGVDDYFEVTNIKVEQASTATPFEPELRTIEQSRMNSYFYSTYNDGVAPATITNVGRRIFYAQQNITPNQFPIDHIDIEGMRGTPVGTVYSPITGASGNLNNGGTDRVATFSEISEKTGIIQYNNVPNISSDDRLYYHYTIDARL